MTDRHLFRHDGSFPGFLCAAAELLNAKNAGSPAASVGYCVCGPQRTAGLFETTENVVRDDGRARRLWLRLGTRIREESLRTVPEAFLSDTEGADGAAAALIVRLWNEGESVLNDLTDPTAAVVERAAVRTAREAHRFMGLVRFEELSDGTFYSAIEPDCDVLRLIADHFTRRFPLMAWAIHDKRRGTAILHAPGETWSFVSGFDVEKPIRSFTENAIRETWKEYFTSIAIESRLNLRLQTSFLPKKHRRNLPEMEAPGANLDPFRPIGILMGTPHD